MPEDAGPGMSRRAIAAWLAVAVVAVSFAAILARYAIGDPPVLLLALGVAFWRTAGGAAALAPVAVRHQRRGAPLDRRHRRLLALSGLFLGVHFALFLGSLAFTTVASSVTLATMSPIFVALGGHWFLGERTERRVWVGMALTIAGAATIGLADATAIELGAEALLGDLMAFGSALAVTGYLLIGRLTRPVVGWASYSSTVFGWAAAALLLLNVAVGTPLVGYDRVQWLAIAGIVVGPQLLGHTVFNTLLRQVPPTVVSIVVLAEPVGATLLAWLLLDELPAPLFFVGAPIVLAGVFLASAGTRRTEHAPSP